jgi:crotonobetainyl-CoA:carnitine CoA-transferase CaiB-like acyl-CoA transferase
MFEALKVLELSSVLAGPAVGQFFAELGASVIKIENIKGNGDVTRSWKKKNEGTDDRSAYFCAVNWGKRSLCVDLTDESGQEIVHKLSATADIVIASYKPGDAKRLGVDYETIRSHNPKIIYGQITGYGSSDPRVGYDAVIQAESGFMSMNGEPGGKSLKMPVAMIDILASHHLKEGILIALLKRAQGDESLFVEVSLLQVAISSLANQATNWLIGNEIPKKQGSEHPNIAPYGEVFSTADGDEMILAIGTDGQFKALCECLGLHELASDEKFGTNADRLNNRVALQQLLQHAIGKRRTDAIVKMLQSRHVPAGVIHNVAQAFALPSADDLLLQAGTLSAVRTYVGSPFPHLGPHFLPPPQLGQHTIAILKNDLQFEDEMIQDLLFRQIVL